MLVYLYQIRSSFHHATFRLDHIQRQESSHPTGQSTSFAVCAWIFILVLDFVLPSAIQWSIQPPPLSCPAFTISSSVLRRIIPLSSVRANIHRRLYIVIGPILSPQTPTVLTMNTPYRTTTTLADNTMLHSDSIHFTCLSSLLPILFLDLEQRDRRLEGERCSFLMGETFQPTSSPCAHGQLSSGITNDHRDRSHEDSLLSGRTLAVLTNNWFCL